jgi:hypothetical protein
MLKRQTDIVNENKNKKDTESETLLEKGKRMVCQKRTCVVHRLQLTRKKM